MATVKKDRYDYNIYKIDLDRLEDFTKLLKDRQFNPVDLSKDIVISKDVNIKLFFCCKDSKDGLHWVNLLSKVTAKSLDSDLKIYGAVLIYSNLEFCYVISYGNAHFYISEYCDYNFGINVAERIMDLDSIRSLQNLSHGTRLNKTHLDYISEVPLSFRSGEIPTYIKGKTINSDEWGSSIQCATSVQMKLSETPIQLEGKLFQLNEMLKSSVTEELPKLLTLSENREGSKILTLDTKLAESILNLDEEKNINTQVNIPSFFLVGTKLVQNDITNFRLSCNYKRKDYVGDLTIHCIQEFLEEKDIDIIDNIRRINISIQTADGRWINRKSIVKYMEYVTEDNFCLRDGKWCSFNNAYIEHIMHTLGSITINNHTKEMKDKYFFSKESLREYAKEQGIESERNEYETWYNQVLQAKLDLQCVHPEQQRFEEGQIYHFEPCDLFDNSDLYFVKIGGPSDFAYAVDQANMTLAKVRKSYGKIEIREQPITPEKFVMVLIYDKKTKVVNSWNEIRSLNFLIHLAELKVDASMAGIELEVRFVYEKI